VKWWGEGAYERETIDGSRTSARTLSVVREGDLIINKIWVRHGSTAIASPAVDGCAASNEFPTFALDETRVIPKWIHWQTKTRSFWAKCDALSRGTSGKNRIKPELFLTIKIPLPPLSEQRRIVARIEGLAAKINEARGLREKAAEEAEALITAQLRATYSFQAKRHGSTRLDRLITEAGYGSSEKCSLDRDEGAVPVLRIPNVASERIDLDDLKFALLSMRERQRLHLANGDILMVRTNGSLDLVGRSAVIDDLPEPMAFASYMKTLQAQTAAELDALLPSILDKAFTGRL
jgi:restriction endonuclease S subunit